MVYSVYAGPCRRSQHSIDIGAKLNSKQFLVDFFESWIMKYSIAVFYKFGYRMMSFEGFPETLVESNKISRDDSLINCRY